jgi:diaminopimelate decarboxylase
VTRMAERLLELGCPLVEVNAGGGLGTPMHPGEEPLDLDAFAQILAARFGSLDVAVGVEPGEFLTNLCGILLAEVVTVEDRLGTTFVGLDAGWNVWNDYYIFQRRPAVVVAARADAHCDRAATLAGHINEGNDLLGEDLALPEVREGEIVALPATGGYCPGMWTDHCMRPRAAGLYFTDRI